VNGKRGPVVASLVGVGVVLLMVVALILPKAAAVRSKQAEVQKAKQQEETLRVQLQQLQDDARHAGATSRQLQVLAQEVPPTADLPGIIRSINTQSVVSGVDFISVSPGQPQLGPDGKYSVIPVALTMSGDFWSLDQFLYRLENLPRVVTVGQIGVQGAPNGQSSASSGTATTTGEPTGELSVTLTTSFFTSDLSAGPGSIPGPTTQVPSGTVSVTGSAPSPSPSPSSSTGGP